MGGDDVRAPLEQKARHGGDDARPVSATDQQTRQIAWSVLLRSDIRRMTNLLQFGGHPPLGPLRLHELLPPANVRSRSGRRGSRLALCRSVHASAEPTRRGCRAAQASRQRDTAEQPSPGPPPSRTLSACPLLVERTFDTGRLTSPRPTAPPQPVSWSLASARTATRQAPIVAATTVSQAIAIKIRITGTSTLGFHLLGARAPRPEGEVVAPAGSRDRTRGGSGGLPRAPLEGICGRSSFDR